MKGVGSIVRDPFYRQCFRMLMLLLVTVLVTKLTKGFFGGAIVLVGTWGALTRRPAYALICFCLLPFMTIMNPHAFGFGGALGVCARLGMPVMALAMTVAASSRPGRNALPFLTMFLYMAVALVSSMNGYAPMISYMKLLNFFLFVLGIYVGTKNIDRNIKELELLRSFFFAFSTFIVIGSLVLNYVNPYAAHYTAYAWQAMHGGQEAAIDAMNTEIAETGEAGFFCGVVNHSQCLGPTTTCIAGWLLCDMLFVEKRIAVGHVFLLTLCPLILYMTKSRTSLLGFVAMVFIVITICIPKFNVPAIIKRRLKSIMTMGFLLMILAGVSLEVTRGGLTKWVLKHHRGDLQETAITGEELTASRRGKIEEGLYDFFQNPMFGKGFQVAYEHQFLNTEGRLVLSAPIEKGFIPTMILGETGVAGMFFFLVFLCAFYSGCVSKKYWVTAALFSVYLVTNLGEATFFSPGGTGGPQWIITLVGGFITDMCIRKRLQMEYAFLCR